MKIIGVCIIVAAAIAPRPAAGQAVDCFKATSAVQKAICTDSDLMALDKNLTLAYAAAVKQATPAQKTGIEAQQRRWATARDACAKDKDLKACVRTYYANRTEQLNAYARGEAPSVAKPHTFACPDKTTVVVDFVGGPKPYAVVTHGASKWTLPQVPAASGARYLDKKVSVWNKGKDIAFDVGGKTQTCTEK